ncbi:vacuolar protein sorting-associated protein 37A isoform X1 [Drosophila novamexicana]|uniref:vacuolar protein sorting-associated protein 37A isoform X1 n=1 Tax=Drosophila novamexicana TaxID=47314 RepID=UPI0011E5D54A|nr:vacuolar protein sorting-associated protein 37A isoform X1 [Drosophila novamexicana]XP_030566214.1 vacuolar protein sorting-associated protein 37A isoform X1 [Drosophila novamexicana]XP_030566215.1 vacuolar protein sorting-associated protein 37A isoform X1 [Drosophila novamexicana]
MPTAQQTSQQQQQQQLTNEESNGVNEPKVEDDNMPNLSTLSLDELKQLDRDPEFFDDFIEEMSVVQHLNEELDSMMNQVENISRENESKGTHLVELKRRLSDDYTALKTLGEKCDLLNKKYLKKSEEYAPQHIRFFVQELLQIAASNADADCDRHVEHFLNGKIDVQTFLNTYQSSKKISAERKAKEERLGTQLTALERAGI